MTTRFSAIDAVNYNVPGVKSGYDSNLRSDFSIPPCGIEDVDVALFTLLDKEIAPVVGGKDSQELKRVPVVFAAGEKWALLKRGKPLRDRNNSLILPLVTIARTSIKQEPKDLTDRGINQQTGEIVVRRRLDNSDRDYQNLINKQLILNQTNVAVTSGSQYSASHQFITGRKVGSLENSYEIRSGALLTTSRKNNIFETLVVPAPQFYVAQYQITIWTQFTQHMNQIIEKFVSSFLPQGRSWKLVTPKGYWFIGTVESGQYNVETSFDDMSTAERYILCSFEVSVPAYIWASQSPGIPIPVKRYVSSPVINFSLENRNLQDDIDSSEEFLNNYLLGNDDPTLPLDDSANLRDDQRRPGWRSQVVQPSNSQDRVDHNDPALMSYPRGINPSQYKKVQIGDSIKYAKVVTVNEATGETVYSGLDLNGLKIIPI